MNTSRLTSFAKRILSRNWTRVGRSEVTCTVIPRCSHAIILRTSSCAASVKKRSVMNESLDCDLLYKNVCDIIAEYLRTYESRESKVIEFLKPDAVRELIDVRVPEDGQSEEAIIASIEDVLRYSVHTAHPRFYNQLFSGIDHVGMLGQFLTAAMNTSMYTFEMAPVLTIMEAELLHRMRLLVGWEDGDGIFTPGGSLANLYGLLMARYRMFPESKEKGIQHLPRLVFFASEHSHYSNKKSAIIMGLGTESVIPVKCDAEGRMDAADLDVQILQAKEKGYTPFAVVATSGTTILGAFDPLDAVAEVCSKHQLWLHVDAAFGGSCLMSQVHRTLMKGSEKVDSLTWDAHKALSVPLQCAGFLLKHKGLMPACNSTRATYLFQQDKMNYDISYDTGDKSIQCGRLNDALKFWLMWKAKGTRGFAKHIENSVAMARYLAKRIKEREGFDLLMEPEFTNVCFYYIPPSLRGCTDAEQYNARLGKVASIIKSRMVECGSMMIGYQPLGDRPNFFRIVLTAPHATESDMDFVLDEIERLGKDLQV